MRHLATMVVLGLTAGLALTAHLSPAQPAPSGTSDPAAVKAGAYHFDPDHARLTWSISHHGFSHFLGLLPTIQGQVTLDPRAPEKSSVDATIPMDKVLTGLTEFDGRLKSMIFKTDQFPTAQFRSTKVTPKSATSADITGNLTFMGQTHPITISATFNKSGQMGGGYIAGFDGHAVLKRSQWGLSFGLPSIGDDVTLEIEAELQAG